MRKVWAVMTGIVRSDFSLRAYLIKLCDLRDKGKIEAIVWSTWVGEIDKFPGLRDDLQRLSVILVETPYFDEKNIEKYVDINLERQRAVLSAAVSIIPNECFVLKLRTDLNENIINAFSLLKKDEVDFSIKKYGQFPIMYSYKVAVELHGIHELLFPRDNFFIGNKSDIDKMTLPISTHMLRKFDIAVDTAYVNAYAYHFFPLLRAMWNVIKPALTYEIIYYCRGRDEKDVRLPRMLIRAYALVCVYVYSHIFVLDNWGTEYDDERPFALIDLFRNRNFRSNVSISKIVKGDLQDSNLANDFKDELRKISLNLPASQGYTYREYIELVNFCKEKFKRDDLVGIYPYHILKDEVAYPDKNTAAAILLNGYGNKREIEIISDIIADEFDSPKRNIYRKIRSADINEKLEDAILISAVLDRDINAIEQYFISVAKYNRKLDDIVWRQALRYLNIYQHGAVLSDVIISAVYHLMLAVEQSDNEAFKEKNKRGIQNSLNKVAAHVPDVYAKKIENVKSAVVFYNLIEEIAEEKVNGKSAKDAQVFIKGVNRIKNINFTDKMNRLLKNEKVLVSHEDMVVFDNFVILLETLYRNDFLKKNFSYLREMCFDELWRKVLLQMFLLISDDERVDFFSMKDGLEMWFYYAPYVANEKNKIFTVRTGLYGRTWPLADRENISAFAGFIKLLENDLYFSAEFSARDLEKSRVLSNFVGYEEKNSSRMTFRLLTKRIPILGEDGIESAVNEAFDDFCNVGARVTAALDSADV